MIVGSRHKFSSMKKETFGLKSTNQENTMVLYPDIFEVDKYGKYYLSEEEELRETQDNYHFSSLLTPKSIDCCSVSRKTDISDQCMQSEVASVLPLARAMGAKVTSHLHKRVTHILCDIDCDMPLYWNPIISMKAFHDLERGLSLHQRLMEINSDSEINVILVSPRWVRNSWS
jgi:hypothetical protein